MTSSERMTRTLNGSAVDHLCAQPIAMTFAARYAGVPYGQYCRDWRVLVRAQVMVASRFGFDVLHVCSDPVREAADCGAPIVWFEDQPPSHHPDAVLLSDRSDLARLRLPDPLGGGRMHDRVLATQALREISAGEVPVLGWIEGPIAAAAQLRGLENILPDLVDDPVWAGELLDFACEMELAFAAAQAPYVEMMGVGDAACSLLGPEVYEELVLPRQERLVRGVQALGLPVRLHVCGRTDQLFPGISRLGVEMMDVDALADLSLARRVLGRRVVLLGNCDPVTVLLEGSPDSVRAAFEGCWREAGWPFVVGSGCEIPPETPAANVEAMMDFARQTAPGL